MPARRRPVRILGMTNAPQWDEPDPTPAPGQAALPTRRGRFALALAVAAVLTILAVGVGSGSSDSSRAGPTSAPPTRRRSLFLDPGERARGTASVAASAFGADVVASPRNAADDDLEFVAGSAGDCDVDRHGRCDPVQGGEGVLDDPVDGATGGRRQPLGLGDGTGVTHRLTRPFARRDEPGDVLQTRLRRFRHVGAPRPQDPDDGPQVLERLVRGGADLAGHVAELPGARRAGAELGQRPCLHADRAMRSVSAACISRAIRVRSS
jgi:hypothetical protein